MKRSMSRSLDKIYQLVKKEKIVNKVLFCNLLDLSPSTFYNYKPFVLDRYPNIIYEDGSLKWIESEDYEINDNSKNKNDTLSHTHD